MSMNSFLAPLIWTTPTGLSASWVSLIDHALSFPAGRGAVLGHIDVEECLYDVADLLEPEIPQVVDDGGRKRFHQAGDLGIRIAHRP